MLIDHYDERLNCVVSFFLKVNKGLSIYLMEVKHSHRIRKSVVSTETCVKALNEWICIKIGFFFFISEYIERVCEGYTVHDPEDFVLEGRPAKPEEFPWMVSMMMSLAMSNSWTLTLLPNKLLYFL